MATNTTNFKFKKPDESDFYDIQDQNGNWDLADAELQKLNTPTFEDYTSGSAAVPSAATALSALKSKIKLPTFMSNVVAFCKGCCTLAMIVNNCVSSDADKPLAAAQGKALMDRITQLNSDLGRAILSTDLFESRNNPRFVEWDENTSNTPYKTGLTSHSGGFAIIFGSWNTYQSILAIPRGDNKLFLYTRSDALSSGWIEYARKDHLPTFYTVTVDPKGNDYVDISVSGILTSWCPIVINADVNYWTGFVKGIVVQKSTIHVLLSEARSGSIRLGISYKAI